jgi:hypothetical protein
MKIKIVPWLIFNYTFKAKRYLYVLADWTVSISAFCIYGFFVNLSVSRDYFLEQHEETDVCRTNGEMWWCLYGTDWILK